MTMTTASSDNIIRAELWSAELKETLHDELMAQNWVQWLTEFPDGTTFTIPSVGDPTVQDVTEDVALNYTALDTGEFNFTISEYIASATYVTKKNEQDSFYMNRLISEFVPKQRRAIMEHFETTLFQSAEDFFSANGQGVINGAAHRYAGGNSGIIELADFAYARYALKKANVPMQNLVAIVDPSVEYTLNTLSNLVDVSNNPRWEGIVAEGIGTDMKFVKNVFGFDVYVSNYLPDVTDSALPERDQSTTKDYSSSNGKANFFFSATPDLLPWMAAWRQEPMVDTGYDMDFQRTKFATTARYGKALYREDNLVTIASTESVS